VFVECASSRGSMGLKTKTVHRIIIAFYLCIFQAAIVLSVIAIMEDRFAIVTGQFKAETLLGGLLDTAVDVVDTVIDTLVCGFTLFTHCDNDGDEVYISLYDIVAEVRQKEIVVSLKEGGVLLPDIDALEIPYEAACDGENLFLKDEEDRERMCLLELAGQAFLYGLISIIVFIVLLDVALILKSRDGRWRYYIGALAFCVGLGLIGIFATVWYMVVDNDCVIEQILEDKLGIVYALFDAALNLFTLSNEERWCFSPEDSWLDVEVDDSLTLLLLAGIIMCCAGTSFCFVMNCCVRNEKSTARKIGDTIRKPFKKKRKCCECPCGKKKGFVRFK